MVEPLVKQLVEAGAHFGHQTHRWNPKMRRYIFGEKNGIYILDLEKTAQGLVDAQGFLRSVAAQGGAILFVGTKRQAQPILQREATRCGQFYVTLRWLGGLLTNFQTIRRSIDRLKTLRGWQEDGTLTRLTKKEAAEVGKEMARLEKVLGGIIEMGRLPKAMVVVDAKREETAVREATRLEIPVVGLVDTNTDPDPISYVIPANDDSIRSISLVISLLADAILEGRQQWLAQQAAAAPPEPEVVAEPPAEIPPPDLPLIGEEAVASAPLPAVDEVEAIIPESTLKVKVEAAPPPKRKRASKPKAEEKETPKG